ncbi:MAG: redoxin domain-containing protein [Bacteroidota bacterium]
MEIEARQIHAPELYGNFWFNGEPVSVHELQGNVILVDFWDFSSINCIRTFPYLREWNRKYREFGLTTVGVHTPEFRFGRDPDELGRAIKQQGIEYPVVADNDAVIWSAYGNRQWPARYLIDKDGFIRMKQQGEGGYGQFEMAIQRLLVEAGYRGELPDLMKPVRDSDRTGSVSFRASGDLFLGYLRGNLGNNEGYNPESTIEYADPGYYLRERFYVQGKWRNEKEFLRFDGEPGEQGFITLQYEALEVNMVLSTSDGKEGGILVLQDGKPPAKEILGSDVTQADDGSVHGRVLFPQTYNLIRNTEFGPHTLRILTSSPNLEVYIFTFVSSVIPDLISTN